MGSAESRLQWWAEGGVSEGTPGVFHVLPACEPQVGVQLIRAVTLQALLCVERDVNWLMWKAQTRWPSCRVPPAANNGQLLKMAAPTPHPLQSVVAPVVTFSKFVAGLRPVRGEAGRRTFSSFFCLIRLWI